jgi:hypothetical protein
MIRPTPLIKPETTVGKILPYPAMFISPKNICKRPPRRKVKSIIPKAVSDFPLIELMQQLRPQKLLSLVQ